MTYAVKNESSQGQRTSELHESACHLRQAGFSVVPLKHRQKAPAIEWKPYQKRRASVAEINSWWLERPGVPFNLGIVTGQVSHDVVLDFDPAQGSTAEELQAEAEAHFGQRFPETCRVATPSGGWHDHYKTTQPVRSGLFFKGKHGKIEVRGEGSIAVMPPSQAFSKYNPDRLGDYAYLRPLDSRADWRGTWLATVWENAESKPAATGGIGLEQAISKLAKNLPGKQKEAVKEALTGNWPAETTPGTDRSGAEYHLAATCAESGLTPEEARAVVAASAVHQAKFAGRADEQARLNAVVERAFANARPANAAADELAGGLLSEAVDHAEWVYSAPELEELWEGLIFRGCVHLLAAPPKKGKSTFLTHLLDHLSGPEIVEIVVGEQTFRLVDGTFLGRKFKGRQRILLITENPPQFWHIRPPIPGVKVLSAFKVRAAGAQTIPVLIRSGRLDLIVVDSLDKALPIADENSNSEISEVVSPIVEAAHETGVAVILVHHHRKGGGSGGEEIRGGSGLFGAVDEYLSLTRLDNGNDDDDDGPMLMSLKPSGRLSLPRRIYFTCTLSDAWAEKTPKEIPAEKKVVGAIREADEPPTRKQIEEATGLPPSTVKAILKKLIETGKVKASGGKTPRYGLVG